MANIIDQISIGDSLYLVVDADPSAAAGTTASINSLAVFSGNIWIKTNTLDTNWTVLPTAATDLTAYLRLLGRVGGQTANGGTAASDNLTFSSTTNATKGKVIFGTLSAIDEANSRFGFGTIAPTQFFQLTSNSTDYLQLHGTVTTANATATAVTQARFATTADSSYLIEYRVKGVDSTSKLSVAFVKTVRVQNVAGTVTINQVQSDYTSKDASLSTCAVGIVASTSNVDVNVTGVAAKTIIWKVVVQVVG